MKLTRLFSVLFPIFCCCLAVSNATAQVSTQIEMETAMTPLAEAQHYAAEKKYDSAIAIYQDLYSKNPEELYVEYLNTLIIAKKFKEAEKLVEARVKNPGQAILPEIDLGRIYKIEGKDAKATEQFDLVLNKISGDDLLTQRITKAFTDAQEYDHAIHALEKATALLGNNGLYCLQLSNLYARTGQLDKAMDVALANNSRPYLPADNLKALFLQWMGDDPKKLQQGQKELMKRIIEQPSNDFYADLLTWIYTQKNDWDGALMQMEAIDERNKETGSRLMNFARSAATAHQYDAAYKAYDDVIAKGPTLPLYTIAKSEKTNTRFAQLKNQAILKPEEISDLMKQFRALFTEFPHYYAQPVAADYATLAAQYADSVDLGIEILKTAIKSPDTRKEQSGAMKLQLGDYYLLKGKIWDASLIYSQVDKEFKQDVLGENARFRNATLAYYRGDFEYAQHLLGVLKASTTELIANDALYLSVQITENVEDSNYYPLTRFAYAGLLLSQNKDSVAEVLLDSIAKAFPKHPLNDDIIMEHAKIALKHHNYEKALGFLHEIVQKYGQDVLGDDALFMTAEIYHDKLNKNDEAKKYYEQLIIDFPGSTFVQTARRKLKEITSGVNP